MGREQTFWQMPDNAAKQGSIEALHLRECPEGSIAPQAFTKMLMRILSKNGIWLTCLNLRTVKNRRRISVAV